MSVIACGTAAGCRGPAVTGLSASVAGAPTGAVATFGMRASRGTSHASTPSPTVACGFDEGSRFDISQPLIISRASMSASSSGWGLRSAWLIRASPKKVQSFSALQPNDVRSEEAAVSKAVLSFDSTGTKIPE